MRITDLKVALCFYFVDIDWSIQANQITALTDKYLLSTWLSVCAREISREETDTYLQELKNAFNDSQLSLTVLDVIYDLNKISR